MSKIATAFKTYFRYANTVSLQYRQFFAYGEWTEKIKADLDAGQPIIYYGDDGTSGHAWICDGYQGTDMFHMNWGWSGNYNGYFNIDMLNPGGFSPDLNQAAVFGIKPDVSQYPYYCSGLKNVTTYDFGTIEDGSGPVADYQDNADCSWLIHPSDSVQGITLHFTRFNTNPSDVVNIYDGPTVEDPLLGTFSWAAFPYDVTSTGPNMLVTFTTDGNDHSSGWMANFVAKYSNPGIQEKTIDDLEIYPVPAHDLLNITFNIRQLESIQVDIISVEGRNVFSQKICNFIGRYNKTMDVSLLLQGIYFIRISTETAISVSKIIIQ
jgi:hypothetical protein